MKFFFHNKVCVVALSLILFVAFLCSTTVLSATVKWKHGPVDSDNGFGGAGVSPDQSELYIYKKHLLRAVDAQTGDSLWQMDNVPGSNEAIPAVGENGFIYVATHDQDSGYQAYAPDPAKGRQWFDTSSHLALAHPPIHTPRNLVYLPFPKVLKAVHPDSGEVLGTFADFEPDVSITGSPHKGSPIITHDGMVILAVGDLPHDGDDDVTPKVMAVKYDPSAPDNFREVWKTTLKSRVKTGFAMDPGRGFPPPALFRGHRDPLCL